MDTADSISLRPGMSIMYGGITRFVRRLQRAPGTHLFESDFSEMDLHDALQTEQQCVSYLAEKVRPGTAAAYAQLYSSGIHLVKNDGELVRVQGYFGSGRFVTSQLQTFIHLCIFNAYLESRRIPFAAAEPNAFGDDALHSVPADFAPEKYADFCEKAYGQLIKRSEMVFGPKEELLRDEKVSFLSSRFVEGELGTYLPFFTRADKMIYTYVNSATSDEWHFHYAVNGMTCLLAKPDDPAFQFFEREARRLASKTSRTVPDLQQLKGLLNGWQAADWESTASWVAYPARQSESKQ
jgi:hypothetical protein